MLLFYPQSKGRPVITDFVALEKILSVVLNPPQDGAAGMVPCLHNDTPVWRQEDLQAKLKEHATEEQVILE